MSLSVIILVFLAPAGKHLIRILIADCNILGSAVIRPIGGKAFRAVGTGMRHLKHNFRRTLHGNLFERVIILQLLKPGYLHLFGIGAVPVPGIAARTERIHQTEHFSRFCLMICDRQLQNEIFRRNPIKRSAYGSDDAENKKQAKRK